MRTTKAHRLARLHTLLVADEQHPAAAAGHAAAIPIPQPGAAAGELLKTAARPIGPDRRE